MPTRVALSLNGHPEYVTEATLALESSAYAVFSAPNAEEGLPAARGPLPRT